MHQNAEGHLQEYNTQGRIREMLMEVGGFTDGEVKKIAATGIIVDVHGEGPDAKKPFSIALRADIDGLEMPEGNPDLPYRSQTKYAHMCGHDGHTATLLMTACILNNNKALIP